MPHIKNLRIGTRALTFWPQRFTTDPDADSLIELLRDVKEIGGRHIAIMSHLSHYRELSTKKVQDAIHRLKQEGGVIIRSQSPVMAGINDDAKVWNKKWKEEVRSRRPVVWRRLHAVDAPRVHQTRSWVVSFSILSWF